MDSIVVVRSILDQPALLSMMRGYNKDLVARSTISVYNPDIGYQPVSTLAARDVQDPEDVSDLQFFIYKLSRAGQRYGVHSFRVITRRCVRQKNLVTIHFRFIRHKPTESCVSCVIAKLQADYMRWSMYYISRHRHALYRTSDSACKKKNNTILSSLDNKLRDWKSVLTAIDVVEHW